MLINNTVINECETKVILLTQSTHAYIVHVNDKYYLYITDVKNPRHVPELMEKFDTEEDVLHFAEEFWSERKIVKKYYESFIETEDGVSKEEKIKIRQAIRTIDSWGENLDEENALKFNHTLTNRLNLLIMAVDGITDRKYIYDFIKKMNVRDSAALRKYMTANEPGVNYNITIERPESLGGGSFETFLQLDQFLFLNIAD